MQHREYTDLFLFITRSCVSVIVMVIIFDKRRDLILLHMNECAGLFHYVHRSSR